MPGSLLLAAGASSRLGRPKQLLVYEGQPLVVRAASAALHAGCEPVVVVTGANAAAIGEALAGLPVHLQFNGEWNLGMGASISCGIQYLQQQPNCPDAVLIMLTDQPFADAPYLNQLIAAYRQNQLLAASLYPDGTWGVPAIFHKNLWPLLAQLKGAQGAKSIIEAHRSRGVGVDFPGGKWDVDTEQDWNTLNNSL